MTLGHAREAVAAVLTSLTVTSLRQLSCTVIVVCCAVRSTGACRGCPCWRLSFCPSRRQFCTTFQFAIWLWRGASTSSPRNCVPPTPSTTTNFSTTCLVCLLTENWSGFILVFLPCDASAERGDATVSCPSVCLSVCPSVRP